MQNRFEYDDPYNNRLENPLEFFAEPFEIKPENKLTVYRYNNVSNNTTSEHLISVSRLLRNFFLFPPLLP